MTRVPLLHFGLVCLAGCTPVDMTPPAGVPGAPAAVTPAGTVPGGPGGSAAVAPRADMVLSGAVSYKGGAVAGAPVTAYVLGTTRAVGTARSGADGGFALGVTGVRAGEMLELVSFGGGHVLATIAFPRDLKQAGGQAGGAAYGRLGITYNTTIVVGAYADVFHRVGAVTTQRDPKVYAEQLRDVRGLFDTFVAPRDAALNARLMAQGAWPAAGPAGAPVASFVEALRQHVTTLKTPFAGGAAGAAARRALTAVGDGSSPEDLDNVYAFEVHTYIDEAGNEGYDYETPDDLPALTSDQLAAIETFIKDAKDGRLAAGADATTAAIFKFFVQIDKDGAVFAEFLADGETPEGLVPEFTPKDQAGPDVTATGGIKLTDGELVTDSEPTLGTPHP